MLKYSVSIIISKVCLKVSMPETMLSNIQKSGFQVNQVLKTEKDAEQ